MKYNRALDLLCLAAKFQADGQAIKAAQAFTAAVNDGSLEAALNIVNASNEKALAALKAAAKVAAKKTTASQRTTASWPFSATASGVSASALARRIRAMDGTAPEEPMPGEEMRVDVEENGDREIQEAMGDDDMSFLDEDGGELELDAAAEDDEEDEKDEDEDEGEKESATARFARFVRNSEALRAAAKKPMKKKPMKKK